MSSCYLLCVTTHPREMSQFLQKRFSLKAVPLSSTSHPQRYGPLGSTCRQQHRPYWLHNNEIDPHERNGHRHSAPPGYTQSRLRHDRLSNGEGRYEEGWAKREALAGYSRYSVPKKHDMAFHFRTVFLRSNCKFVCCVLHTT